MTINCISESVNYVCKITHRDPGHGYIMQETAAGRVQQATWQQEQAGLNME